MNDWRRLPRERESYKGNFTRAIQAAHLPYLVGVAGGYLLFAEILN